MNPDFQREHVWTEDQQTSWLEFFYKGGRTGRIIYLNHPGWQGSYKGEFLLVDGKQRMEAARRFFANEIKIFGSYFNEFTDKDFGTTVTLKINVNTLKTREEVLRWYLQFNGGGTPHTEAELERVRSLLQKESLTKRLAGDEPVKQLR